MSASLRSPNADRQAVTVRRSASPWFLIGVVLISLLGMHFLSGRDSAGHHLVLKPATTVTPPSPVLPEAWADHAGIGGGAVTAADLTGDVITPTNGSDDDQITVIGCALLLLVGLGTALALLLRRRSVEDRTPAKWFAQHGTVRGPPTTAARLLLCVERI